MEKKLDQATSTFHQLQRLGSTQKGLSFRALRQLYIACVTTIADYGIQLWWRKRGIQALVNRYQRLQNLAVARALGAFKGSPSRALELEAAVPPPGVRFEKACTMYSLRTLLFQLNHPIKAVGNSYSRDELADLEDSDQAAIQYIQPTTQLLQLLARLKKAVGSNWNIEKVRAQWEAPWAARPLATVSITGSGKAKAREEHLELLHSIPNHFDESVVYYTDGSQGKLGGSTANSAAVCQWGDNSPVQAQYWNLGSAVEVADAEVVAIVKALELAIAQREQPSYCYVFSDSQATI